MRVSEKVLPAALVVALLLIADVPVDAAGEGPITIDALEFDPADRILSVGGSTSIDTQCIYFAFLDSNGKAVMQDGFAPVKDGRFQRDVLVPASVPEGSYTLKAYYSTTVYSVRTFTVTDPPEVSLSLERSDLSLTVGGTASVGVSLTGADPDDLVVKTAKRSVATAGIRDGKLEVTAVSVGTTNIVVYLSGETDISAELTVTVSAAPVVKELRTYTFFIQITKDMDQADTSPYSESDLRSGITISAEEYDAAAALQKACDAQGIDCSMNDKPNDTYYGWILSLFGLKQYQTPGTEAWTYWIQYHNGSYNQWTLGHYTDGGSFSLIWGTTLPDGSDPDDKKDDQSGTSTDTGGSTTTTTTTEDKKQDGSIEKKTEVKTEGADGSSVTTTTTEITDSKGNKVGEQTTESVVSTDGGSKESVSKTEIAEDGSSKTSSTTVEIDREGNETSTVVESSTKKDADGNEVTSSVSKTTDSEGNISESRTESVVKETTNDSGDKVTDATSKTEHSDGTIVETESSTTVSKDGRTTTVSTERTTKNGKTEEVRTETESSTVKNKDGSETTTTVETVTSGDSVVRTESSETVKKDGTLVTEEKVVSSDKDGNVTGTTTTSTEQKTSGGRTTTKTTETSADADGNTTGSKEVTVVSSSGKTTISESIKDADGKEISSSMTERKDSTEKDGTKVVDVTTTTTSEGVQTDSVLKRTESKDGSERTSSITTTTTTSEGSKEETSMNSTVVTDEGTTRTYATGEKVIDKDGNVTSQTRTEKEKVDSDAVSSETVRKETTVDDSTVKDESVTVEAKDGSVRTDTSYSSTDGNVTRAESTTVISASGSELGEDTARAAVEQSESAISKTTADASAMKKTFEVTGSEGTSVTVTPGALGAISGHGAGLKVGGSDGRSSVHMDEDTVKSLSDGSSATGGDVSISLDEGKGSDLNDAQKDAVGDSFFVVLSALIGDMKVHDLGGTATVMFGYDLPEGVDPSKARIVYVDDNGDKSFVDDADYDLSNNWFIMELDHFSVFMVEIEEDEPEPTPVVPDQGGEDDGDSTVLYAAIAVIIVMIAAAAVLLLRRRA